MRNLQLNLQVYFSKAQRCYQCSFVHLASVLNVLPLPVHCTPVGKSVTPTSALYTSWKKCYPYQCTVHQLEKVLPLPVHCTPVGKRKGLKNYQYKSLSILHFFSIPYFHYRDNSVHFHECSPFCVGIFTICI